MSEQPTDFRSRQKLKHFENAFAGDHLFIQLDARPPEVEVPPHLKIDPALRLKLSARFQGKTTFDDRAITAYLKFDGNYEKCVMPWTAVWAITAEDGQTQVWPEDVPKELLVKAATMKITQIGKKLFRLGREPKEDKDDPPNPSDPGGKRDRSHIKRVK